LVHLNVLQLLGLLGAQLFQEHDALVVVLVQGRLSVKLLRQVLHVQKLNLLTIQLIDHLLQNLAQSVKLVGQSQAEQVLELRFIKLQKGGP